VRTRHRDALTQAHQLRQHHRTRHDGDATLTCRDHLRVVRFYRRRSHYRIGILQVVAVVTVMDGRAQSLQTLGDSTLCQVRATYLEAQVEQHLGDTVHAGTTDADEVDVFDLMFHLETPFIHETHERTRTNPLLISCFSCLS
jgi:hypothetical protein